MCIRSVLLGSVILSLMACGEGFEQKSPSEKMSWVCDELKREDPDFWSQTAVICENPDALNDTQKIEFATGILEFLTAKKNLMTLEAEGRASGYIQ